MRTTRLMLFLISLISFSGTAFAQQDSDGDGINDDKDKCPMVKGVARNSGCPPISDATWKKFDMALADVHFDVNSDSLGEGSRSALSMVATLMEANKDYTLKISGYADSTGTEEYNKMLSEKRAVRVKNYLIEKGVPENRIMIVGYGDASPVMSNSTESGRAKNRRVEFDLVN